MDTLVGGEGERGRVQDGDRSSVCVGWWVVVVGGVIGICGWVQISDCDGVACCAGL